jgi:hypothetical protein
MEFVALIHTDEAAWAALDESARNVVHDRYGRLFEEGKATGVVKDGAELAGAETATTVRVRDGRVTVTDGPYAEVKEALGGYFLVECDSMDEALDWAARIPGVDTGWVEVRQVDGRDGGGS